MHVFTVSKRSERLEAGAGLAAAGAERGCGESQGAGQSGPRTVSRHQGAGRDPESREEV